MSVRTAADLLRAFVDGFNRGDVAAISSLFADGASFLGAGKCKGCPCVGRPAIKAGVLVRAMRLAGTICASTGPVVKPKHEIAISCPSIIGTDTQASARWVLRNWNSGLVGWSDDEHGPLVVRGWHSVTAKDDFITEYRLRYDLNDPRTLMARRKIGDVVFDLSALSELNAISSNAVLLLGTAIDPNHTPIVVYIGEPETDQQPMSIHIVEQNSARSVFRLNDAIDGHSETMLDLKRETLLTGRYGIEIRRGDGEPIMRMNTLRLVDQP